MTLPALTRIRITLVDTDEPPTLDEATGGLVTYADLYDHNGGDAGGEASIRATIMQSAGILRGYWAAQPSSIAHSGSTIAWSATERAAFYEALSKGEGLQTVGADALPPTDTTIPVAFTLAPGRRGR